MAFQSLKFTFDGIASENYNLYIGEINYSPVSTNTAGSSIQLETQEIYRRATPYLLGVTQNEVLEFDFTMFCLDYSIDRVLMPSIMKLFFGKMGTYNKLQIIQCDMYDFFYRCKFTKVDIIEVANKPYGFKVHVVCDAPWGWQTEQTTVLTTTGNTNVTFYNSSDNDDYLYPTLNFTLPYGITNFQLVNITDNNRATTFTSLSSRESMVMDNERQILTSSTGLYRLSNFNKNWFRLLPGENSLRFNYSLTSCSITYNFARKIGGS